jgi:hypothetical protein
LGTLLGFAQTFPRAPLSPLGAKTLTLMMCLKEYRQLVPPFRCATLAFHFRFGAFGEETFNTLKTNVPGGSLLGMVKLVIASQAIYHLNPLSIPPRTLKYINKVERAFL